MTSRAIQLFDERAERLNLALPIFFLLLVLVTGRGHLTPMNALWANWLASTLGMNVLHNTFSFSYFAFPEFRAWAAAQSRRKGRNILLGWGIIICLIVLYFQVEWHFYDWPWPAFGPDFSAVLAFAKLCLILRMMVATYHAVGQHYGLSLLYNKKYLNSDFSDENGRVRLRRVERVERCLFRVYNLSLALLAAVTVTAIRGPKHILEQGLLDLLVLPILALAAAINIASYWYPGQSFRRKRFFLLRLFLPPLALVSQAGLVGYFCVHGIESLLFFRHITGRSALTNRKMFFCLTFMLCLCGLVLSIVRQGPSGLQAYLLQWHFSPFALSCIFFFSAISLAITYVHYFIEAKVFHFSDPLTREHLGPLVLGPGKS